MVFFKFFGELKIFILYLLFDWSFLIFWWLIRLWIYWIVDLFVLICNWFFSLIKLFDFKVLLIIFWSCVVLIICWECKIWCWLKMIIIILFNLWRFFSWLVFWYDCLFWVYSKWVLLIKMMLVFLFLFIKLVGLFIRFILIFNFLEIFL